MNEILKIWNYENSEIRTVEIEGEPYFVGKDVAAILGYSNTRDSLAKHVDEEDKNTVAIHDGIGNPNKTVINESGLYSLILSSKLPNAKQFKRWVTSEVLPAIRKHGAYMTDNTLEQALTSPDFLIKLATELKNEKEQRKTLEEKVELDKPKVLFAEAVETAKTSILVGDLAKLIKQNGVDIGQKRLFEYLRENGYLMKNGNSKNMPTQKGMSLGLFEVKERTINNPDGTVKITKTTKVTGKGQTYFINKFLGRAS